MPHQPFFHCLSVPLSKCVTVVKLIFRAWEPLHITSKQKWNIWYIGSFIFDVLSKNVITYYVIHCLSVCLDIWKQLFINFVCSHKRKTRLQIESAGVLSSFCQWKHKYIWYDSFHFDTLKYLKRNSKHHYINSEVCKFTNGFEGKLWAFPWFTWRHVNKVLLLEGNKTFSKAMDL